MKKKSQLTVATYNLMFMNGTEGEFGSGKKFQLGVMEVLHTIAPCSTTEIIKIHCLNRS